MAKDITYTNLGEHKGYTILINDDTLHFRVNFGDDDYFITASAEEMKVLLDERRKMEAKAVKLALPVITSEGKTATITGLHMGTSKMLGTGLPKHGRMWHLVYPVVPWVADAAEYEGVEEGEEGLLVAVMVDAIEAGGTIVISYAPNNYTPDVWVDLRDQFAVEELERRLAPILADGSASETADVILPVLRKKQAGQLFQQGKGEQVD